jgi:hypothetical protein
MKMSKKLSFVGGAFVLLSAAAIAAPKSLKLYMNGAAVSTDVRVINGVAYAPISSMAKALKQPVTRVGDGYRIGAAGGTYQISGLRGKLGDKLSDGVWQLTFSNLREEKMYTDRNTVRPFGGTQRVYTPDGSDKLYVIDIIAKNIRSQRMALSLARGDKFNTSLAGMDGTAVPVKSFDFRSGDGGPYGAGGQSDITGFILPGAQQKFSAIFSVPSDFDPKDLVFTIAYNFEVGGIYKTTDFRVALKP